MQPRTKAWFRTIDYVVRWIEIIVSVVLVFGVIGLAAYSGLMPMN